MNIETTPNKRSLTKVVYVTSGQGTSRDKKVHRSEQDITAMKVAEGLVKNLEKASHHH